MEFISHNFSITQVGKVFSSLGYTVAFGAVLVKMWRVYIIFHNPGAKRRVSCSSLTFLPTKDTAIRILLHLFVAVE